MKLRCLVCLLIVACCGTAVAWPQDETVLSVFAQLKAAALTGSSSHGGSDSSQKSALCQFTAGPRKGETQDYAPRDPIPVGSACNDGAGSSGRVIAPRSGGDSAQKSTLCQFTAGPRKGETQDYAPRDPIPVGSACNDGAGSSGRVIAPKSELTSVYDEIKALTDDLYARYLQAANTSPPLSPEYVQSLADDFNALQDANSPVTDKRAEIVRGVRDDLKVKVKFLPANMGVGGTFPSVVRVTVETEQQGKTANGLWVHCNPLRYGPTKTPMFSFNSITSPTTRALPPGMFIMWVESTDGSKVLLSRPVTIGENGADHESIKLALP